MKIQSNCQVKMSVTQLLFKVRSQLSQCRDVSGSLATGNFLGHLVLSSIIFFQGNFSISLSNLLHLPELVTQIMVEHIAIEVEDKEDMEAWKFVEPVTEVQLELINWLYDNTAMIYQAIIRLSISSARHLPDKEEFLKRVQDM